MAGKTVQTISLSIDRALCVRVDRLAAHLHCSRSQLIAGVVGRAMMAIPSTTLPWHDEDRPAGQGSLPLVHAHDNDAAAAAP
jgi:hypothetical protein